MASIRIHGAITSNYFKDLKGRELFYFFALNCLHGDITHVSPVRVVAHVGNSTMCTLRGNVNDINLLLEIIKHYQKFFTISEHLIQKINAVTVTNFSGTPQYLATPRGILQDYLRTNYTAILESKLTKMPYKSLIKAIGDMDAVRY